MEKSANVFHLTFKLSESSLRTEKVKHTANITTFTVLIIGGVINLVSQKKKKSELRKSSVIEFDRSAKLILFENSYLNKIADRFQAKEGRHLCQLILKKSFF